MFETLLLAAAMTTLAAADTPPDAPATAKAPPTDLLEFIGDWSEEEAKRFLDAAAPAQNAQSPQSKEARDAN